MIVRRRHAAGHLAYQTDGAGTLLATFTYNVSDNGGQSYAGISHYVLLRYTGGAWTEYGR